MLWVALLLIMLIWGGAIIWAAWRARWIVGATAGLALVLVVIEGAQRASGRQPIGYGIALGLSIFLAAAMVMLGIIATGVKWLARNEQAK